MIKKFLRGMLTGASITTGCVGFVALFIGGIKYIFSSMHFHHRNPSTKVKNVSQMLGGNTIDLLKEIAKCDLLCANCHAIRTWGKKE